MASLRNLPISIPRLCLPNQVYGNSSEQKRTWTWNRWDPCSLELDKPLFITSNIENSCAIIASTTATRNGSWTWADGMLSVCFPVQGAFVFEGYNRVLVVLRCQTKFRVSNKKKRIEETSHTIHSNDIHCAGRAEVDSGQQC
jgi:hypothetical protein